MPARKAETYRAARRNAVRGKPRLFSNTVTPPTLRVVEGMLRAWLMRRHGVSNAPAKPRYQIGPSKHGKDIIATHLTLPRPGCWRSGVGRRRVSAANRGWRHPRGRGEHLQGGD